MANVQMSSDGSILLDLPYIVISDLNDASSLIQNTPYIMISNQQIVSTPDVRMDNVVEEIASLGTELEEHSKKKGFFKCEICEKKIACISKKRHLLSHTGEKPYECEICHKAFKDASCLPNHMRIHTGEKPFECQYCEDRFRQSAHLTRHVKSKHQEEEKIFSTKTIHKFNEVSNIAKLVQRKYDKRKGFFKCSFCQKVIAYCNKKRHLRQHTGEKPYECNICLRTFGDLSCLRNHRRIHTGEKPYECLLCEYRCRQSAHLKRHVKGIHQKKERMSSNILKDSEGNERDDLGEELKTFKEKKRFKCTICQKEIAYKSKKRHLRMHMGEKPYECGICSKKFLDQSCLSNHVKIHTGEKPYECLLCDYRFRQSAHLSAHMKKKHTSASS